jgi:hypothetical protein
MRGLLRKIVVGTTALVVFRVVLWGLYRFVLPEWYTDVVLFGEYWSVVFVPLPVIIALTVAGVVLLLPTWLVAGSSNRS